MKTKEFPAEAERIRIGKRCGTIGLICNTVLAAAKLLIGYIAGSMAIMADGFNNFTDAASSVVTLLGFKFSEKPADREHPYGHARYEYLASLTVSMLILVIGFELVNSSVRKILHPAAAELSPAVFAVLTASILVKLFMMILNRRMGKKIASDTLIAVSWDSRNDIAATGAVLIAAAVEALTEFRVDGIAGLLVALFILFSGVRLAKETISPLLGEGADPELYRALTEYIESCPQVLGCHDLMVHDYGPTRKYATIHVEMDRGVDALDGHEMIDRMERECKERFGVHMVIHYDPLSRDDPETERLKKLVLTILKVRDARMEVHDFRVIEKTDVSELVFDVTVPVELQGETDRIQSALEQAMNSLEEKKYTFRITFDL